MTTTIRRPPTKFSAIFQLRSLRARVTIFTLTFFLISIWSLAFYSSFALRKDMEKALGEQQFSTVSIIATEINSGLDDRMKALEKVAAQITPAMLGNAAAMQTFIEGRAVLPMMFNGGFFVLLPDGTAIADFPLSTGRRGRNFMDRKYAIGALKEGKTTIGNPVMGKALRSTLFSIATPIYNTKGKVIGALAGTVDLAKNNFISRTTDNSYGKTGGYLLVSPKIRTIVYATDKKRLMEVLPRTGINPLIERFIQGYEGFAITIRPDGVEVLTASQRIPVSDWNIANLIPTKEAFAPINAMMWRLVLATIFLTLLAGGLTWWMLRRQLTPVFTTIKTLASLSDTDKHLQSLPIARQDEIGEMIGSFNRLLETLGHREEALKESELKYRSLIEFSSDAIFCVNEKGEYKFTNHLFSSTFGKNPDYFIGKTFWDIYPKEHADYRYEATKRVFQTGKSESLEVTVPLPDKTLYFYATADPIKDETGKVILVLTHATDITNRKQTEIALRKSEEKFRHLFNNAEVGMFRTRLDGSEVLDSNDKYLSILGMTREEFIGNPSVIIWNDPKERDEMVKTLKTQNYVNDLEFTLRNKAGELRNCITSLRLYPETGILEGSITDITDRKQAEAEKRILEERLQRAEKMESLGLLAGGVAHDLNNVLGIVVGYSEMVLGDIDEKSPLREYMVSIMDGGQKAAAIVQDMLTLTRRGVAGRKVLNLNNLISDFKKSPDWQKLLDYHPHVQINIDLEPDLLNISGSAVHLEKTLFNLVSNAGESMTKGGLLTITSTNQYLDKPISGYDNIREGDYVVLSVSDEGEGISESDLKRIFEPFYTKKIMGRSGTGLGLSVVWGTVKDHQGYIDVNSQEGKGTTFKLYFPVTREDITAETSSVSMSEYMGKGESILIVDDVKGQRDLASAMLKKLNYTVTSVSGGEEAIEYLKKNKVDLLVLDMIMEPGMDGLDTYKKVIEIHPKQRAIIVSGFSESDRVHDAQVLGAGEYVRKPYVIEKLGLAVRKELDRK